MASQSTLLILCESSPESYRPAGERVRHLALASKSVFEKTVVLTLGTTKRVRRSETSSRVLIRTINFRRAMPFPLSAILDPVKLAVFFVHGFIAYMRFRPSVIISSMPPLETGLSAWFLAKFLGLNLVIDLRDNWESAASSNLKRYFPERILNLLFVITRMIYSSSRYVLAATQTIAETISNRTLGVAVEVVPNGADSSIFSTQSSATREKMRLEYSLPQDKVVIIYAGSGINLYNRLDVVLASLKDLPRKARSKMFFVFYVYGGSECLEKQRQTLELTESLVEIRNPLNRVRLAEVMGACDIGLVPFEDKPYLLCARSTKLYEYISAGLYVISSGPSGGELSRFFSQDSDLGLFTTPSVNAFSDVFQTVLQSRTYLFGDIMRDHRHSFIEENYSREKIMKKAVETLIEITTLRKNATYTSLTG